MIVLHVICPASREIIFPGHGPGKNAASGRQEEEILMDECLLEKFYQTWYHELIRWCSNMTGDMGLAEDLVQEAFLRAISHLPLLETLSEKQQRAWFYRTVKNLYLDRKRHERYETVAQTPPQSGQDMEEYAMIDWAQLLDSLPGDEGALFVMRYLEGYTSAELGEFFGLPPGTVRSRLSDARKHLKAALKVNLRCL